MSSNVAAPNGDNGNHQGHCSRCGKVWILKESRAFVSGAISPQAVKAPLQSPVTSSLGQTESESNLTATATGMTTYKANG